MSIQNRSGAKRMGSGAPQAKPKSTWSTVKRLLGYMKKSALLLGFTVIVVVAGTAMQVVSPKLLGNATTLIFDGIRQGTGIDFHLLGIILLLLAALYIGVFLTSFSQQRMMTVMAQKTTRAMRGQLKAKMSRVPVSYFDKHQNGDLMSAAINDVDNIVNGLQRSLISVISSVVMVAGVLCMMITISPLLTLAACVMIPGSLLVMKMITPKTQKYNAVYFSSLGKLNTQIEESYQGFTVIKSFNGEAAAMKAFDTINNRMIDSGFKAQFIGGLTMPAMMLVQNIIYVFLAAIGCVNVVSGSMLIGNMQAFLQYSTQFSSPLMQLSQIWSTLLSMLVSAERIFEVLDADEMDESYGGYPNQVGEEAKVVFDHVQFGYGDVPLMGDFNMEVQDGQLVAIVGHTGAGKTTLINLLERFYEIQDGSLRIDGSDIRNKTRQELRKNIGIVLQDTWLFSGTIYDNIKYGNENATDEEIYGAAKAANADEFIQKMHDGYDTVLCEGADNISQGQRQLITIARAFAASPDILILDEATSNVDSRTELIIQQAMKRLLKGRTSFVVAPRISTLYEADRILVMEHGDIVETGTHKELMCQNGTYADIYNSQFAQAS